MKPDRTIKKAARRLATYLKKNPASAANPIFLEDVLQEVLDESVLRKRHDKLFDIAVAYLKTGVYPEPVLNEDQRMVNELEKARTEYVSRLIEQALPTR